MSNDASETMGVDAQMGVVRVLRPYPTFAAVYEGQPVTTRPIALTEGGEARDEQAGDPGYDPELVRGLPVPIGAKCLMWFPNCVWRNGADAYPYVYTLYWRLRNAFDFRQRFRKPFHYPKQAPGVPETLVNPGARVVVPAACHSVLYVQAEGAFGPGLSISTQNVHHENFRQVGTPINGNVLNPNGVVGAIQQGIANSSALGAHYRPAFLAHELTCAGDELIVLVNREDTDQQAQPLWAFAGADAAFAGAFSPTYPDIGVYVSVGVAP